MKILVNKSIVEILKDCERPAISNEEILPLIDEIFENVRNRKDQALRAYSLQFDKVKLTDIKVSENEINAASGKIKTATKAAIKKAAQNIRIFHEAQELRSTIVETSPGVKCWQEGRGIERVGIYIPGGTAPLFSTVLMLAIPAQIAQCREVILCTPPGLNGTIDPHILYAAQVSGVKTVFKVGGAQAIAAMTLGTESIPAVYKIFGPGNQFVTAAKLKAQQFNVAIDMPAGPSEIMIIADESANADYVASDILSQAEHGVDSQAVCIVESLELAKKINSAVEYQLKNLPRRQLALKSLENSRIIVLETTESAIDVMNKYAPEHLILCTMNNTLFINQLINAGSVFIGNYTPESAGDYASGTNHTLPTNGFARNYSGVNLDAFIKKITFQEISREGLQNLGPTIEVMAEAEHLIAHKNAVSIRLKSIEDEN
ncbi:MAG: histidinol dehydrogenase [Crocinitomicaceae bacterium]|nr:histidinol dehydrogenase [Crocinitomicaceae bacterium]